MTTTLSIKYLAAVARTITLAGLPTDSNLLAGRQSDVLDNSTNLYPDYQVSGKIQVASASVSAGVIEVWAAGIMEDGGPTYPDVLTAAGDAAKTLTSTTIKQQLAQLCSIVNDTTNSRTYPFVCKSLRRLFDGCVPSKTVFFAVHSSGQNLQSGNIWTTPIQYTGA